MADAFPLNWPHGWPRTPADERDRGYQFKQAGGQYGRTLVTFPRARDLLYDELRKLGAGNVIVSSNHPTDRYGIPVESKRRVDDQGVAVYFELGGKKMSMACDRFTGTAANMRSLGLAIEALRQLERHGGGTMMERAFTGFAALPAPNQRPKWFETLGLPENASAEQINDKYRQLVKTRHPDAGGSHEAMQELLAAKAEGIARWGKAQP